MSKFIRRWHSVMGESKIKGNDVVEFIEKSVKPWKYTHGLGFRSPTIHNKDITKERAVEIWHEENGFCDVEEYDDYLHINSFMSNDFW